MVARPGPTVPPRVHPAGVRGPIGEVPDPVRIAGQEIGLPEQVVGVRHQGYLIGSARPPWSVRQGGPDLSGVGSRGASIACAAVRAGP